MSKKLTLNIDEELISFAHSYSRQNGLSVSRLFEQYLDRLRTTDRTQELKPTIAFLYGLFEDAPIPGYNIVLTSNNLAAYVQLYLTNSNAIFSNNFMHICAENEVVVFCETNLEISQLEEQLRIICLNNQNAEND